MGRICSTVFICLSLLVSLLAGGCGGGGGGGGKTNAQTNSIPLASAGADQTVSTHSTVTLDGSQSTDPNGDLLSYSWSFTSKPGGSQAMLSDSAAAKPTFTADVDGNYVLSLVVNDGQTDSAPASVTITASSGNVAPMANAGADQSVTTGATVTLDGSASSDANQDPITFTWSFTSKPATSSATLSDATAAKPVFTADVDGDYVLGLVVNDGQTDSAPATVTITASSDNVAPVADAGADKNVTTGATIMLDGTGSSDANQDLVTYKWAFVSKPASSSAALTDASIARPSFTADVAGTYILSLVVNDGQVDSQPDTVTITAANANTTPVADAGSDRTVSVGSTVNLDGTGSSDADQDPLTYQWSFVSKPAFSTASLSDVTSAKPTFYTDKAGDYVVRLMVNDGKTNSLADTVTVTAAAYNAIPVADAGADQEAAIGMTVTLDGTGSSDADQDPLTYSWSFSSVPAGSTAALSDPTAAKPAFVPDVSGSYVIKLTVYDGSAYSLADSVTIDVLPPQVKWVFTTQSDIQGDINYQISLGVNDWIYPFTDEIYVVSRFDVHALNEDGSENWDWFFYDPLGSFNPIITPVTSGTTSGYFSNIDVYVGLRDGTFQALDRQLGVNEWNIKTNATHLTKIVVSGDNLYFGEDSTLTAHSQNIDNVTVNWTYDAGGTVGDPAVDGAGNVYFGCSDNNLYALDATGAFKWTLSFTGGEIGQPVVAADGTIYVIGYYDSTSKKELVAINPDGTLKWVFDSTLAMDGTPVIGSDGTVYTVSSGSSTGGLYAVNPDGSQKWAFPTLSDSNTSPVLTADGSILVVAGGQNAYVVTSAGIQSSAFMGLPETIVGSPVVGLNGTIYVATTNRHVYAIDLN